MLQSTKNKETLSILKQLRQKGAPERKPVSMDMAIEVGEEDKMPEQEVGMPDASGTVTDLSLPGALPMEQPIGKPRKKKVEPSNK